MVSGVEEVQARWPTGSSGYPESRETRVSRYLPLMEGVEGFKDGGVGSQTGDGQGDGTDVYTEHLTEGSHA